MDERYGPARPGHRRRRRSSGCPACSSRRPSGSWRSSCSIAMLLGTLQVLADELAAGRGRRPASRSSRSSCPSVAAVACLGAIRLVPFGLWLVPALAADRRASSARSLALEARIHARPGGPDGRPTARRSCVTILRRRVPRRSPGVAAMVPGGLVQPAARGDADADPGDAACWSSPPAMRSSPSCSGYRAAALRVDDAARRAAGRALTYAVADRDRGGGAPGDGDPAAHRAGPADARVLPVGRVPRRRRRRAGATAPGSGRSCCSPCSGIVVVAWNLLLRG